MKMKSKIFGLNAKLALAVLAVGTMFTGCYDSENGDVKKPYVAPDPVYYIAGTVTDLNSGLPLPATVAVTGESASANTDAAGSYRLETTAGTGKVVTVTVTGAEAAEYTPVTRTVDIPTVDAGESYTAVVNVALSKDAYTDADVDVTVVVTEKQEPVRLTAAENVGLDLTADDNEATFERTFKVVNGYAVQNDYTASAKLEAYISKYLGENVGEFGGYKYVLDTQIIKLKPWDCLIAVSYIYDLVEKTYTFTAEDEEVVVEVEGVAGYEFGTIETQPNHDFAHSHGHGHGHGENLNAGGGILDPEM